MNATELTLDTAEHTCQLVRSAIDRQASREELERLRARLKHVKREIEQLKKP